jgi:hypothetical protein
MQIEEDEVLTDDVPDPYVFSAHTASGHSPCAAKPGLQVEITV